MEARLLRLVTTMVLSLLLFATQGSGTEDAELIFLQTGAIQTRRELALGIHDLPLTRKIVERRLHFESSKGRDEERVANVYVDIDDPEQEFRISLSLMEMKCDGASGAHLLVTSEGNSNGNTTWCDDVEHDKNDVAEGFTVQGEARFSLKVMGNWSNTEAFVLATIYYEANSCSACDSSSFCCKSDKCASGTYQTRCISKDLRCNGFPNCGMICENPDEERGSYGFPCGFDMWSLMWMISMAITFFVFIPIIVVVLFCYNRQLSIERRNRPHPDPARRRRHNGGVVVHSPPDDLPPTYDDLHDIKVPPPGFSTVVVPGSEGCDNPAMIPDAEHDSPAMHSMQSRNALVDDPERMGNKY